VSAEPEFTLGIEEEYFLVEIRAPNGAWPWQAAFSMG
jgi:hypothetical protein